MLLKKLKFLVVFFSLAIIFDSCRTKEKIATKTEVESINEDILVGNILKNQINFETLFFKRVAVEYNENGKTTSVRANIFIKNNEEIIISVVPLLGIEVARVLIQPGKIVIIDRFNKEVYNTNFGYVKRKFHFDLDFNLLQSILTNSLFSYPDGNPSKIRNYEIQKNNGIYTFTSHKEGGQSNNPFVHRIDVTADNYRISRNIILNQSANTRFDVRYENFTDLNNKKFPYTIRMNGQDGNERYGLSLKFSSVDVNDSNSILFSIPDSYDVYDLK